ncbi:MAG: DUF2309 domain-containing protein [Planctomyces sp.]|nr:DUF2309 domain-containing protein [Planctomyces sp.]
MSTTPDTRQQVAHYSSFAEQFGLEQAELRDTMKETLIRLNEILPEVWPLKDYVALSPYDGLTDHSFLDVRRKIRQYSDCELLMPLSYYREQYQQGAFTSDHLCIAVREMIVKRESVEALPDLEEIVNLLEREEEGAEQNKSSLASVSDDQDNRERRIRSVSEYFDRIHGTEWSQFVLDEISKHCSQHYDEGEAIWSSPWKGESLYAAWHAAASGDLNPEVAGLDGFRDYVRELPQDAEQAILYSLIELYVPVPLWEPFLLCQAFRMPGWTSWANRLASHSLEAGGDSKDLAGLLAMRLAYEVVLSQTKSFSIDWSSFFRQHGMLRTADAEMQSDVLLRYVLLKASEIAFRSNILSQVNVAVTDRKFSGKEIAPASKFQFVFCIDVRSERIRRHLEHVSEDARTSGFAGFFGMPIEYVPFGHQSGTSQVPVLLKPSFKVYEDFQTDDYLKRDQMLESKSLREQLGSAWKTFQKSAISSFSFIETFGWLSIGDLFRQNLVGLRGAKKTHAGCCSESFAPSFEGLKAQGVDQPQLVSLAESMLRNLGMTSGFSRVVVLCGHASETVNNPGKAGLDCGACGGHSGEANARFAALLLNDPDIRKQLELRGISIPETTCFVGGLHNTTADKLTLFPSDEIAERDRDLMAELKQVCDEATHHTQLERCPLTGSDSVKQLLTRAADWSEVRPEWGLSGNAAFIVAPRELSRKANLDGQCFLHDYQAAMDPSGEVLETIMTAPMIVTYLINMQYYASVVDTRHFGSGNKTIHNMVGKFGLFSGNGGDLMTGLPWESLHDGQDYQHLPRRLQVMIAAPRQRVDEIVLKHSILEDMFAGEWLHLLVLDEGQCHRYIGGSKWETLSSLSSETRLAEPVPN